MSARALLLAGALAASLAGCNTQSTPSAQETTPEPSTTISSPPPAAAAPAPPAVTATETRWVDLQPGQCLAEAPPEDPAVVMVAVVDCAGPHAAEVFHRTGLAVNTALAEVADQACSAGLASYTGGTGGAGYAVTYLIDSDQNRRADVAEPSTLICVLSDPGGATLTGSKAR